MYFVCLSIVLLSVCANKVGWRIDYFIVSEDLKDKIVGAEIYDDVGGSDHVPVELVIEI